MSAAGPAPVRVGIDVGGTFTDLVLCLPDGRLRVSKVASTADDPGQAVLGGLADLLVRCGVAAAAVTEVVHATTVPSNTILQQRGARTGLLTTRGFRDVLEIGRVRMPDLYDLTWQKPRPLVARRDRLEVDERLAADGTVVRPLDHAGLVAAADRLVAAGVEVLAVAFLHSHASPVHEREAGRVLRDRHPGVDVTLSSDVLPEIKEYERTSTTVVNAYLLPVMRRYLTRLAEGLGRLGIRAPLLVVASNGGVMGAAAAAERPVFVVGSGPAAGVSGAARLGQAAGAGSLIAFDMGGTTAKASLVEDGRVSLTTEYEFREGLSTSSRFIKAGGYLLKAPTIDIAEVGAGGGSLGWVDAGGLLRVGPESAGAWPGPACYGLGGDRPTVTDANLVLGLLGPRLAGGALRLDPDRARDAVRRHVAAPLGLGVEEAAHGIREVANASMARAIRSVTVERGRDPRELTLVAFGGNGPVHACDVAAALEIRRVLVPPSAGVFTALGMLASDVQHHFVRATRAELSTLPVQSLDAMLDALREEALSTLGAEGYPPPHVRLDVRVDLRYAGQASELTVPVPGGRLGAAPPGVLRDAFTREYAATYGHQTDEEVEIVNLRVTATGERPDRLDLRRVRPDVEAGPAGACSRPVAWRRGFPAVETPVMGWPRGAGAPGARPGPLEGPLVIETYDSTLAVPPGARVELDGPGNLLITLPDGAE